MDVLTLTGLVALAFVVAGAVPTPRVDDFPASHEATSKPKARRDAKNANRFIGLRLLVPGAVAPLPRTARMRAPYHAADN